MITVVDYGMCNLGSVLNMFRKVGIPVRAATTPDDVLSATKIVLPGVGRFDQGVRQLKARALWDVLDQVVRAGNVPLLGICLGMQLMLESSDEGDEPGFGWVPGRVRQFRSQLRDPPIKVPHMGWNRVLFVRNDPLWRDMPAESRFYFVHSYLCAPADASITIGECEHGETFCAAFHTRGLHGVQFHPEKSHSFGMRLLANFGSG